MCIQFVCHICGEDLEDNMSFLLCFNSSVQTRSRDHIVCPDYVRKEIVAPTRCNLCLAFDSSTAGSLIVPVNPTFDYIG